MSSESNDIFPSRTYGCRPFKSAVPEHPENDKIRYQFYRKTMANPLLIMARSAMRERVKRTALAQQVLTIMTNTSQELPEDLKTQLLSEFSGPVRASGYGARYRLEIIKSAMTAFDKMREQQEHSGRPINRPRSYQRETTKKKKISAKSQWYKAGPYKAGSYVRPWHTTWKTCKHVA